MAELFLKLDGFPGESTDAKHKGEIELLSYDWGVEQAGQSGHAGGGMGAGKATFRDFSFQMGVNQASPALFLACAGGKHIPEATLSVRRPGERPLDYLTVRFRDVVITAFEQASGDEEPVERVAFEFANIEFSYTAQDARGGAGAVSKAGWDLRRNAKI